MCEPARAALLLGVAAGLGAQPFGKFAYLRLSGGELRSNDEIRARSDQRLSERRDERARLDEIVDQGLAAERHTLPADRRLNHLLILAEVKRARRFELADAERREPGTPIHISFGASILEMQQSMMNEIPRLFERPRLVTQQRAAAHRDHLLAKQPDRAFRHRLRPTVADGNVDEAALEIERVGGRREPHVDVGMQGGKAPQPRNEPERSEACRRGNGELARPGFRAEPVGRGLQPIEDVGGDPIERLPVLGQRERT
jgi:hypothetical protein